MNSLLDDTTRKLTDCGGLDYSVCFASGLSFFLRFLCFHSQRHAFSWFGLYLGCIKLSVDGNVLHATGQDGFGGVFIFDKGAWILWM